MFFEIFDQMCAEVLEVKVEVFIDKIESTTELRRSNIIEALLSNDLKSIVKARKLFNLIK